MALTDVNELLYDPDLVSELKLTRRTQVIDPVTGVGTVIPQDLGTIIGVVGPVGDNALSRLTDYQLQGKTMQVVTAIRLRGPSKDGAAVFQPDVVIWPIVNGDTYVVSDVKDYTAYGAGFVDAVCSTMDLVINPPQE